METPNDVRRLYKSRTDRMIDGVCGGVAEYFQIDPTLVRIVTVLLVLLGGVGIVVYFAGMIIMPTNPVSAPTAPVTSSSGYHAFWGILLVIVGIIWFMGNMGWDFWHHWWWFSGGTIVPVLLILAGVAFLFGGRNYVSSPGTASGTPAGTAPADAPVGVRRLYRSRAEKKVLGVCGGIGEYMSIDPVIVRILFVLAAFASFGFVLLAYVVMAIVVPYAPTVQPGV